MMNDLTANVATADAPSSNATMSPDTTGNDAGRSSSSSSTRRIEDLFHQVVELVRNPTLMDEDAIVDKTSELVPHDADTVTATTFSDQEKLRLYGLFKLIQDGPCPTDDQSNFDGSTPSIFQPVARAKYLAWKECSEDPTLSSATAAARPQAMMAYVQLVTQREDRLGRYCQELWKRYLDSIEKASATVVETASTDDNDGNDDDDDDDDEKLSSRTLSERQRRPVDDVTPTDKNNNYYYYHYKSKDWLDVVLQKLGVQPMLPRGRLDIDYSDLWFSVRQCAWEAFAWQQAINHTDNLINARICALWKEATGGCSATVGLSVRSLFDLYLTSKGYPEGSEILVVPPISVPGMMLVAQYHNLRVIPVDLDLSGNSGGSGNGCGWISLPRLKSKITKHTVAIMLVHPFGMVTANHETMQELRQTADDHGLELWEDCAECFMGLGKQGPNSGARPGSNDRYVGHALVDVRFFSFGSIKTSTALGGGIAVFKSESTYRGIERLQHAIYHKRQTAREYFFRVLLALVLNFLADSPLRVGLLVLFCKCCGLDFDSVVTRAVRGFRIRNDGSSNATASHLVAQIRKRPSSALLKTILRRLEQSKKVAPIFPAKVKQCQRVKSLLKDRIPKVLLPDMGTSIHAFWAFPISCGSSRATIARCMQKMGFDVVSGASQLCSLSRLDMEGVLKQSCVQTDQLMDSILYLPICSQRIADSTLVELVECIRQAVEPKQNPSTCERGQNSNEEIHVLSFSAFWIISALFCVPMVVMNGGFCQSCVAFGRTLVFWISCIAAALFLRLAAEALLHWTTAEFYLKESSAFAEHCDMVGAELDCEDPEAQASDTSVLSELAVLKLPAWAGNEGVVPKRSVVVTGATGFVGSALLRDLLLHRERLGLDRVILICRQKGGQTAAKRVAKLLNKPMFRFCTEHDKKRIMEVIEGDVTLPSAGLKPLDLARICQDISIAHVIHCAAVVSFTQEFPDAASSNITSALTMQSLTARLKNKEAQFVHVSTAFVHGNETGSMTSPLPEELSSFHPFDPLEIYKSMLGTQYYASKAMADLGFHNTYSFSKSVCEHLLSRNQITNTLIFRPSIVGPAVETPYEGWAGDRPSTIVAGPCLHLSHQWNIWCLGRQKVPFIPVDVLSRFILAKSFDSKAMSSMTGSETASSSDGSFECVGRISEESSDFGDNSCAGLSHVVEYRSPKIFNATWNSTTNRNASFSWLDFSVAYLHMGSVFGFFSRSSALLQLFVSAQIMPTITPSPQVYEKLHSWVIRAPIESLVYFGGILGFSTTGLEKLLLFLDLPLLFYPFVRADYVFQSEIIAPDCFDAKRYSFSCGVAAFRFICSQRQRHESSTNHKQATTLDFFAIGGRHHSDRALHIWWALSQPAGELSFRIAAAFMRLLLWRICTMVTVDITSFRRHLSEIRSASENGPVFLVLAPTHRSFFDFILLSYVFFSVPELQLDLPFVAAAEELAHLPIIGWLARMLRAIYIRRGRGTVDKHLSSKLEALKKKQLSRPRASIEVFIEGQRSRDRRFLPPKTGFLKCLHESGGSHVILPITINYESIAEEASLADEAAGANRKVLSFGATMKWLWEAINGSVMLGRIHIAAGNPLTMKSQKSIDFKVLVDRIQLEQKSRILVSDYHVKAASIFFRVEENDMRSAMASIGCNFWPNLPSTPEPKFALDTTSQFAIVLQFAHQLAPLFYERQQKWSIWLDRLSAEHSSVDTRDLDESVAKTFKALANFFDMADSLVQKAISSLNRSGFEWPRPSHVFQTAKPFNSDVPLAILYAAVTLRLSDSDIEYNDDLLVEPIDDNTDLSLRGRDESIGYWGFQDSGFVARVDRRGRRYVSMKGSRYRLSGKSMTKLLPFIESELQVKIDLTKEFARRSPLWRQHLECDLSEDDQLFLHELFPGRVSLASVDRARHGAGHSQDDVFLLRVGDKAIRIPDAVVWPTNEDEIVELVRAAIRAKWCLIPFGGGTNVINATRCPSKIVEPRPILSVDMKHLNRIEWLNEEDGLAMVQAGITGRQLMEQLDQRGYTMGHEPDSIEFSTLGGWIATKASGMKRSKYGNIEDIVVSSRVVSSEGVLWKGNGGKCRTETGRQSEGMDVSSLVMGSEGCLGIISSAIIRVWPLPERREHDGILFPCFEDGLRFIRALARERRLMPACVRLLDNAHFRLGQVLRPDDTSIWGQLKDAASKVILSTVLSKTYKGESVVCATISYEGSAKDVRDQSLTVRRLAHKQGGVVLGPKAGRAGYDLTFMIAYLRDFAMTYHILGESFETFCPWSKIESLVAATKQRIQREHSSRLLPGLPFVGCRVTQLYHEGVCLYFYLCMSFDGIGRPGSSLPSEIFADLERAARDEILKQGGSLSHHHGVGKVRAPFIAQRTSPSFQNVAASIKESVDKANIFGARNGLFSVEATIGSVSQPPARLRHSLAQPLCE